MDIDNKDYPALNAQASNYRVILRFLLASGINDFLERQKRIPLDLMASPEDTTGGESAILFLKSVADECNVMDKKIISLSEALVDLSIQLARVKREPKKSLFQRIKEFVI